MAAIIELKYFNSFTIKKIKTISDVTPGTPDISVKSAAGFDVEMEDGTALDATQINVGQEVSFDYVDGISGQSVRITSSIVEVFPIDGATNQSFRMKEATVNWTQTSPDPAVITFGNIVDFDNIPAAYKSDPAQDRDNDWLLEESRIRGGFNNVSTDFGVRAYLVEDDTKQSHKFSGLIHSGIFNSRTGFNATNQFSVAEDITRTIDPANGSIQKLYAEDTNLIIFQENKVSKSLIDKDAIYTAEGNPQVTATNKVIGQNVAYAGEYGISTDPESFAVNGYRKYFTDRNQNIVCRLSRDGITPISNFGMTDFFRDKLSTATDNGIKGGWDAHSKQYVVSIYGGIGATPEGPALQGPVYNTLAFDEAAKGWTSRYSYLPDMLLSLNNDFYTSYEGKLYKHHTLNKGSQERANFYGVSNKSTVTVVFNGAPSSVKNMNTVNYEGDTDWEMTSFETNTDTAYPISKPFFAQTLEQMENNMMVNNFKPKEDKYYGDLMNSTGVQPGEVIFSKSSSGVKGFYGIMTMSMNNSNVGNKELFAVSTVFVPSS